MFVDSDDILNQNAISEAVKFLEYKNLDVIIGRYKEFSEEEIHKTLSKMKTGYFDFGTYDDNIRVLRQEEQIEMSHFFFPLNGPFLLESDGWKIDFFSCWGRLIKRSVLCDITFPVNTAFGEDSIWSHQLFGINNLRIGLASANWYAYVHHPESLSHKISAEYPDKIKFLAKYVLSSTDWECRNSRDIFCWILAWQESVLKDYYFKVEEHKSCFQKCFRFYRFCNDPPFNQIRIHHIHSLRLKLKYLMYRSGLAYPWYAAKEALKWNSS